ncbi:glycine cleavage system protein GcvH [Halomicroarcula sp. F13]|uniref:Probable glycine cleavage system H protein n=1 Tax=Haloarcula rubra TaxID=2487747 RepID=A0AAW4PZ49_9EURY|nr:glycine cleavage system protein GcvH [Halomicroarcula rubra]MBX0325876.1 glycine cleavage system protein GcvH [Halomicroarcula rubra]
MEFDVPDEPYYTESHEWIELIEDTVRIGITDFAQDELGDIVFVELPAAGTDFDAGDDFAVIESIKAVSDVYAPVAGVVADINEAVESEPELVNEDPYGDGWLIELELDGDLDTESFLSASEYREQIE